MNDDSGRFAFDTFPRGSLSFHINRRQFLPALLQELTVACEQDDGRPTFKLADLGLLPDDQLAVLIPRIVRGCSIHIDDSFVWGKSPGMKKAIRLFPLDSPARIAFNGMNGMTSIGEISTALASASGWDAGRSFSYVRGLFLWLVIARVCQPVNTNAS